ncbi:mucin-2 [Toxorhynchites rutilus septentrionalis]|uniref:mucin-2 n=1 Tax=Toxorhynchites rutilus septentrionalis TaxID=329112 RepID=UPI0024798080|nr:mucin-2 [Toxorhynchites rutilus septentrionalis]
MHNWRSIILQICIIITCYTLLNVCSMRLTMPARMLAVQAGATRFQEYAEEEKHLGRSEQKTVQKRFILNSADSNPDNYQGVVGRPGVDFPILTRIPNTEFSCQNHGNGYFADLDTKCQVFHICDEGKKISFLCPNGTIFRQLDLICDWWFKVDCTAAPNHYAESSEMLAQAQRARVQSKHPVTQPIKSPEQFSLNIQRKHALLSNSFGPNLEALAINRRMDSSVEHSNESIDFEDISIKQNNFKRKNWAAGYVQASSKEIQTAAETGSFVRAAKLLNGYNYPTPDKKLNNLNLKNDGSGLNQSAKVVSRLEKNQFAVSRTPKIFEKTLNEFSTKNSLAIDAKPFIVRATESSTVVTSTSLKQSLLTGTVASMINRGSTTYQTSTLNQKSNRKPNIYSDINHSPDSESIKENFNQQQYTTARKLSTKTKDKPFYTPTIPTVTNRIVTEQKTPVNPTIEAVAGASEHAIEMMKTLQNLEMPGLENRSAVEIPPSSGPSVLHSLALYFASNSGNNDTSATVPVRTRANTDKSQLANNQHSVTLLSHRTLTKYQQLFNPVTPSATTESLDIETRLEDDTGNDLEPHFSTHSLFSTTGSSQIRELAQVFTHALSAYLQNPESFRRILSDIRPKAPPQLITSNRIDNNMLRDDDISAEHASYFSSNEQITPAPQTTLNDELEVLDFSDVTLPTTVKREITFGNTDVTTETPFTTTVYPVLAYANSSEQLTRTPASALISESLEAYASAYRERQSKEIKMRSQSDDKNDLADEVNKELGAIKPLKFKAIESIEQTSDSLDNSSYFPMSNQFNNHRSPSSYGKGVKPANSVPIFDTYPTALSDVQAVPLLWGEKLSAQTTTTASSPTVYIDLLPPHFENSNLLVSPSAGDALSDDDEQLQRAQSQSVVLSRNDINSNKKSTTKYSFLSLDEAVERKNNITFADSVVVEDNATPSTTQGHYITKQFRSESEYSTTLPEELVTSTIPDIGKISSNSRSTLSYAVFLNPLTINDDLLNIDGVDETTVSNTEPYLSRINTKTTTPNTSPVTPTTILFRNSNVVSSNTTDMKNKLNERESNENEVMETMQKKANQMFGDLNDSEADHLMNVMKKADTNKSVRRLILLLIQTCDDDFNRTVEDSRRTLLNALINMDSNENESSEIRIVKSKTSRSRSVETDTKEHPTNSHQYEKLRDTTTDINVINRDNFESSETTSIQSHTDAKSTYLDNLIETTTNPFTSEEVETTTTTNINFPEQYTTPNILTTDYDTTITILTTTEIPTTTDFSTTSSLDRSIEKTSTIPTFISQIQSNVGDRIQKSLGSSIEYVSELKRQVSNQHSDTRALELLRSLYSLASRWG